MQHVGLHTYFVLVLHRHHTLPNPRLRQEEIFQLNLLRHPWSQPRASESSEEMRGDVPHLHHGQMDA
jgi:hypothetical protein